MRGPLVSVIVPVYNREAFVRETLESVLAQDYEPFEVIVVDDGSTDGSGAIVQSFDGVRYVRQENQGPAAARNAGIAVSEGEFLAFCDSDDIFLSHKLTVQVGYLLDHPELSGVMARQEWITPPPNAARDLVWGDVDGIQPLSLVIRRAALLEVGCFDPALWGPEDTDLLVRLREGGYEFLVLPEIVMRRRYHGDNLVAGHREAPLPLEMLKAKLDRNRASPGGTPPRSPQT